VSGPGLGAGLGLLCKQLAVSSGFGITHQHNARSLPHDLQSPSVCTRSGGPRGGGGLPVTSPDAYKNPFEAVRESQRDGDGTDQDTQPDATTDDTDNDSKSHWGSRLQEEGVRQRGGHDAAGNDGGRDQLRQAASKQWQPPPAQALAATEQRSWSLPPPQRAQQPPSPQYQPPQADQRWGNGDDLALNMPPMSKRRSNLGSGDDSPRPQPPRSPLGPVRAPEPTAQPAQPAAVQQEGDDGAPPPHPSQVPAAARWPSEVREPAPVAAQPSQRPSRPSMSHSNWSDEWEHEALGLPVSTTLRPQTSPQRRLAAAGVAAAAAARARGRQPDMEEEVPDLQPQPPPQQHLPPTSQSDMEAPLDDDQRSGQWGQAPELERFWSTKQAQAPDSARSSHAAQQGEAPPAGQGHEHQGQQPQGHEPTEGEKRSGAWVYSDGGWRPAAQEAAPGFLSGRWRFGWGA
jgi:hypothetical protein